eukprot:6824014-Alexandrium_andersonii.AAC.1
MTLFSRAVLSTAFIECSFAAMRQRLLRAAKPLSMASLSAKQVTHAFQRARSNLLKRAAGQTAAKTSVQATAA